MKCAYFSFHFIHGQKVQKGILQNHIPSCSFFVSKQFTTQRRHITTIFTSTLMINLHLSASDEKIWSSKVTKILYTEHDNSTCHWTLIVSDGSFFQPKRPKHIVIFVRCIFCHEKSIEFIYKLKYSRYVSGYKIYLHIRQQSAENTNFAMMHCILGKIGPIQFISASLFLIGSIILEFSQFFWYTFYIHTC
jgi:hypothetical protein